MKTKLLLSVLLLSTNLTGYGTTWTVTNNGFTFSPATITITEGDEVNFTIATAHNASEVSQTTWNANGNTVLPGGFQTPFGGGLVTSAQLTVGTHYYVCTPHASLGMKGTIIVQSATSSAETPSQPGISVYLQPSSALLEINIDAALAAQNWEVEIFNTLGVIIYQSAITNTASHVDLSHQSDGIYLVRVFNSQAMLTQKIILRE